MAINNYIKFKLTKNRKPASWQLPLKNIMVKKEGFLKKIEYIKGSDSIFAEDHKGDEKPGKVWFEQGFLFVHRHNTLLIHIIKIHPMYGKEFVIVDEDVEAEKILSNQSLIKKALFKVDISDDDELKANGIVLIGSQVLSWSPKRVRAALNNKAFESPRELLDEMGHGDYHAKYITSLGLLKGVIKINPSQTAVTWANDKTIINVPVGQNPIERLGLFLSSDDEGARTTLQEIGEKSKRPYIVKRPVDIDAAVAAVAKVSENKTAIIPEKDANLQNEDVDSDPEMTLEEARAMYTELIGAVPVNKKNDLAWILSKLTEQ